MAGPGKWTKEERKRHIKKKYSSTREKVWSLVMLLISLLALMGVLYTGIAYLKPGQASLITVILLVIFLIYTIHFGRSRKLQALALALIIIMAVLTELAFSGILYSLAGALALFIYSLAVMVLLLVIAFLLDTVFYECE